MLQNFSVRYYIPLFFCLFLVLNLNCQNDFYDRYKASSQKYVEGKFHEALQINLKLLEVAEQSKIPSQIAYANLQVGNMRYFLQDRKGAIKWYMAALNIVERERIDSMKGEIYHNISVMYNEMHQTDSTLKYSQKAIANYKAGKNYRELSRALSALVDVYIENGRNLKEGERLINEAERYAKLSKDSSVLAFALTKRAILYGKQKRFKEAAEQLKIPEEIYRKNNVAEELMYLYRMGSKYYTQAGDPIKGMNYMDSLLKWRNDVFKTESAKKAAEYEALYQTAKKDRENKILQQENELKQVQIDSRNKTIIGLAVGILLIVAMVAWRITVLNLKKKEKELLASMAIQKEKVRISRDLHDNVGGQLSYVLYSIADLANDDKQKRIELSGKINESIRSVISSLRETIWAINDEEISMSDFSDKLKVYTRNLFKNTHTHVTYTENITQNVSLNSSIGLNLYRICQEVITNSFKHARAGELKISLATDKNVRITISDNGVGFNLSQDNNGSYGLANIHDRAKESGISIEARSTNEGTSYALVV